MAVKLRCKVNRYIGRGLDLTEGEVVEVSDELAHALLTDFPQWFEVVNEEPEAKEAKQEQTKELKSRVTK
jgi:hypothetical protein